MLRFRYLFENYDLAKDLVAYYNYDKTLFDHFRISANMIYPFEMKDQIKYLRVTPVDEVYERYFKGELELLTKLEELSFPCVRIYSQKDGELYNRNSNKHGVFFTTAFDRVPGIRMDQIDIDKEIAYKVGLSLAKLHIAMELEVDRPHLSDILSCMEKDLMVLDDQKGLKLLGKLEEDFHDLDITHKNYGLIHFDYEDDNLFYDDVIYPIDFNDSMYGFYWMDVHNAASCFDDYYDDVFRGYESVHPLSADEGIKKWSIRFKALYGYTRMKRAAGDVIDNEPDWMKGIRDKFEQRYSTLLNECDRPIG